MPSLLRGDSRPRGFAKQDGDEAVAKDAIAEGEAGSRGEAEAEAAVAEDCYAEAVAAFRALEATLQDSTTGYFFSAPAPGLFDAAVFAYTHLLLDSAQNGGDGAADDEIGGTAGSDHASDARTVGEGCRVRMGWTNNVLGEALRRDCPELVGHRRRILQEYYPG